MKKSILYAASLTLAIFAGSFLHAAPRNSDPEVFSTKGGKRDYTDGTSEYFWFNKCSFNGAEETGKTADDTTDSAGMTLPFTAYKTTHKFKNGKTSKVVKIDTATTKLLAEANWTAQVVTPDNLADVCEKVTVTE